MATRTRKKKSGPRPLAAVTGASAGIGAAFAHALAARGYDLLLIARRRRKLEAVAEAVSAEHGVRAEVLPADLTSKTRLRVVEEKIGRSRRLELLVNNAGLGDFAPFAESDREREDAEIRLNALGVVRLCHAAVRGMVRRGSGAIINVSSTASFAPCPGFATYGATKAFLNSFTEALDSELEGTGVRVQALCPGLTHTEIFSSAGADTSALPSFLWMEPEEVVQESLDALEGGPVIFVPGLGNRALSTLIRVLPHAATRQIGAVFAQRYLARTPRR
jgi:short-subunit dehydrogenase